MKETLNNNSTDAIEDKINRFLEDSFLSISRIDEEVLVKDYFVNDVKLHVLDCDNEHNGIKSVTLFLTDFMKNKCIDMNKISIESTINYFSSEIFGVSIRFFSYSLYSSKLITSISSVIIKVEDTLKFKDITIADSKSINNNVNLEKEFLLRTVFETSNYPIFIKDLDFRYLAANKHFLDMYNIESEELIIGGNDKEVLKDKYSEECRNSDLLTIQKKSTVSTIEICPNEDGQDCYYQVIKNPFYKDGKIMGLIGYINDITDFKIQNNFYAESESEIEYIFNKSEVAYFVKGKDKRFTRINKAFEDLFNVKREDIIGKLLEEVDWKYNKSNMEEIKIMFDENSNQECTHVYLDKDRKQKYLYIIEKPLKRGGELNGIFGICRDITQSVTKKIELNKRYTNSMTYRKETLAFVVVDLDAMKITECYTRNEELDLIGKKYNENTFNSFLNTIIYERDKKDFYYHLYPTNLVNNFSLTNRYKLECDMLTLIKTSMTARITIDYSYNFVTNHKEAYVYATDIFKERQMREITKFVNSKEYDLIVRINFKINTVEYIISNQPSIEERVGELSTIQSFLDCLYESNDTKAILASDFLRELKFNLENSDDYRYTIDFSNGRRKSLIVRIVDRENCVVLVLMQDITSITHNDNIIKRQLKKAVSNAEEANKSKSDFLARMSHDMRTPLNGIIGLSHFGNKESTEPVIKDYFTKISSSSNFLLSLINDVLDMQSIEIGKLKICEIPIDTKKCLEGIGIIISPRAKEKNIHLNFTKTNNGPGYIMGDCLRLQQVFSNILGNAIKYTPFGGTVNWVVSHFEKDGVVFSHHTISDNGIGMSVEFQNHMFESFSTEPNKYSQHERSSGLGLAIVKTMVELMKGEIRCYSELNKGTTFIIELPLKVISKEEYDKSQISYKDKSGILENRKILLCEDNKINVIVTKKILAQKHIEVDVAINGKEGVEKAHKNKYDAILMDIRMPIMDGLKATEEIRHFDKIIPIIALSANAYEEDRTKSIISGMNAHISKPINQMELFSTLKSLL